MSNNILILKLGATGDVVRTTTLLWRLTGQITWVTAAKNAVLLQSVRENLRCLSWEDRQQALEREYDLVINLEDTMEVGVFLQSVKCKSVYGAYVNAGGQLTYTEDSRAWFDLSLISTFGKQKADRQKYLNQRTYQELVFSGLGYDFRGEQYILPEPARTDLHGDVAIAPEAGPVWPMKNWAYYAELKRELEARGLSVNVLPKRNSLLEHLGDVRNHRCLVSGDSLPMHFALGMGTRCVSLFTCTSPHEIYDYGLQTKIVSPYLEEFFFQRGFNPRAVSAISVDEVLPAVLRQLDRKVPAAVAAS